MPKVEKKAVKWLKKYLRLTDYLGVAQLYLKDNFFLDRPLEVSDFKARILGHWGTVPGLNFIYASMDYLVKKHDANILFVTGPGHGAPAILANLFAEKTLHSHYKEYTLDKQGAGNIIKDFSWPYSRFPSHVTPTVPGSILEGGELGYSLSTAFGAVLDNPDLIVAVAVGDGESETGPLSTAWHCNKFLNPKTSGAVLPVVHINGYKISNPTIYGTMSDKELTDLFKGYGYYPMIVKGPKVEEKMLNATEKAYKMIRAIQKKARAKGEVQLKPMWPVILLRTPKGWKGIEEHNGKPIENSFNSHGVPIEHPKDDPKALKDIEKWLKSYHIHELLDEKGTPLPEVLEYVPTGASRIGMNKHSVGGNFYKPLKFPALSKVEVKIKEPGQTEASSMKVGGKLLSEIFKLNKKNYRIFCPDEVESNKLGGVFSVTKRGYMWPLPKNAVDINTDGRVTEMLSEHTLQGLYQGYLLTGRHGMFVTYEAFAGIISTMVDQYAKFIKQAVKVKWRKPVASAVYVLSSLGWRQDHNGFSHQNPSFISNVLQKHGKFAQLYFPSDANSMIAALEETMKRKDAISVIVAGKRELPQWQTLKQAREQAKNGIAIWEWVGGKFATKNPDVVLASAGDYITQEALFAVKLCKELVPELKIRYVNVSELTSLSLGDYITDGQSCLTKEGMAKYLTKDRPVIFSYHGYTNDVEQVLWQHADADRFTIHGYKEEGSTTTPFDIKVRNGVSCYHLVKDLVEKGALKNKAVAKKKAAVIKEIDKKLRAHHRYIEKHGDDPEEVKKLHW